MTNTTLTQYIAVGLIVFASVCIALGSRYGWHDLVSFASTFGGAGAGILTGHQLAKNDSPDA